MLPKKTKVIATLGPATSSTATIERLIKSGMNVARLNLSHGSLDEHADRIITVRRLSQRLATPVAILIDLPGPKYRTGTVHGGSVMLKRGAELVLTTREVEGDGRIVSVNFPSFPRDVKVGNTVLLDDGAMQLKVINVSEDEVKCRVTVGGRLIDRRGIAVPGMHHSGPFITETLVEHIDFAIEQKPDYVALSFVSCAEDIEQTRAILQQKGTGIPIIAKIERGQAVANFDSILDASDGIMVARGDLGVDIPLQKIPLVQKEIISKCNQAGKPVITATQMLESMVESARPTRAEVTDVANAILDGSDAIMLSGETAVGKHPAPAVRMMVLIAKETERHLPYESWLRERRTWLEAETDEMISYNACQTAHQLDAAAIVAFTRSGSTARRVSKYRPRVPILALTPDRAVLGQLLLCWGVQPQEADEPSTVDGLFALAVKHCRESRLAKPGDLIVITGGIPLGISGTTNLLKVEKV
ncbi:MAG: pyruvate kinase [Chloroflexota bacterium]